VRPSFRDARHHRQDRLFAVQGLDLAHMGNSQGQVREALDNLAGWLPIEVGLSRPLRVSYS
jgi:hypothetical protein